MYIADLHIHSKYSRATSRECAPECLDFWAGRKGIDILGTGDFTHPAWRQELEEKLEPAEEGLYKLKPKFQARGSSSIGEPRFVISGEISSIYKKDGKTRKVHNLILLPGLEEAKRLSLRLEAIGNIHSDGRPILGLDCRDLLEITLETCPKAIFIPAHIWTPHFSLFGAFSGFDAIEECFGDLTGEIHALETGLSSDPPMNWRLSALDGYNLVSNSDAHSPAKLGREANLLDIPMSYAGLYQAIQEGKGLEGTIEFFPEEGKYHMDGHRKCDLCLSPMETKAHGGTCPVCGKKLTIGVLHRVEELADRPKGYEKPEGKPFESLVPLQETIAASTGKSPASVKVKRQYDAMTKELGSEFSILRDVPLAEIKRCAGPCIEEGIRRLRQGKVERIPGYDGEYGKIKIIREEEIETICGQVSLFESIALPAGSAKKKDFPKESKENEHAKGTAFRKAAAAQEISKDAIQKGTVPKQQDACSVSTAVASAAAETKHGAMRKAKAAESAAAEASPASLPNSPQERAISSEKAFVAVIAGPGTGKTYTLVHRIKHLVENRGEIPSDITAVTFTNKAAESLRLRMRALLGKETADAMTIGTFHAICLNLLKEQGRDVRLADAQEQLQIAAQTAKELDSSLSPATLLRQVSLAKNSQFFAESPERLEEATKRYQEQLIAKGLWDFDDLLLAALQLKTGSNRWLLVDEFQDVSPIQYELVRKWGTKGLFAIGDPDQSIYGFRGSDARCFARLQQDYPQMETLRLEKNYRSSPEILDCALPMIGHNPGEKRKLAALAKSGQKPCLITASSDLSAAIFIAQEINRMTGGMDMMDAQNYAADMEKSRSFSDIAVLYRTHQQAKALENCLRIESIPYTVTGREDFLDDPVVKEAIAFFQWMMQDGAFPGEPLATNFPLNENSRETWQDYEHLAGQLSGMLEKERPADILKAWGQKAGFSMSTPLKQLTEMALFYEDMAAFLDNLLLGEEQDFRRNAAGDLYESGAVSLMTLHAAKGLEFPVVFLYGLKEGCVPMKNADLEEERRLFYVGMTRAGEELLLVTTGEPSRFLAEIPPDRLVRKEDRNRTANAEHGRTGSASKTDSFHGEKARMSGEQMSMPHLFAPQGGKSGKMD